MSANPDIETVGPSMRPDGVSFVVALAIMQGAILALMGLFTILDREDVNLLQQTQLTTDQLSIVGVGVIIIGIVQVLLATALGRGSSIVRYLFGIVALLNVAGALWGAIGAHGEQRLAASFSLVVGLAVVWILFGSDKSSRFFHEN